MDSGDPEESEANPFEKDGKEKWVWIKNRNLIEIHKKIDSWEGALIERIYIYTYRYIYIYMCVYKCVGKRWDFE